MQALIRDNGNEVRIADMPTPSIAAGNDVMVRVRAAAVCSTDVAIVSGAFGGTTPRILGHEVAGEVVETGPAVKALKVGDGVALQPTIFCGECPSCGKGNWHLCPNRRFVGLDTDGGFAELMVVPEVNLIPVPQSVSFRHACMAEPLACVIHAISRIETPLENGVIITGAGISAYLFTQVLISGGLRPDRILVTGRREARLAAIERLGAHVLDVRCGDLAETAADIFGDAAPEVLIDQTGDPDLLLGAMDIIARQGMLFIYDFTGHDIPFNFGKMQLREITVRTSTGCPGTMPAAIEMIAADQVDLAGAISHTYKPSQMKEAYETLITKDPAHIKSVIEFD
ncbi:MAG: zinc-dependent alcohol dehydrogenase [Planctomycetota bacterium]|jgi:L-iditol 2-dehydrogenase